MFRHLKIAFGSILFVSLVMNIYLNTGENPFIVDPFEIQSILSDLSKKHVSDKRRDLKPLDRLPADYNCSEGNDWRPEEFLEIEEGLFIYAAYYDTRKAETFIRVTALTKQSRRYALYCGLDPGDKDNVIEMSYYNLNENHRKNYGGGIFSCRVPESWPKPCRVFVFNHEADAYGLRLYYTSDVTDKDKYGICVPLLEDIDMSRVVEFLELSQILGASFFIVYKDEVKTSPEVDKALRSYEELGLVSMLPWKLPPLDGSLWQRGEILAMNDCMYRSMGKVEFLSLNHVTEFIIPKQNNTIVEYLGQLQDTAHCGYCFSTFFLEARRQRFGSGLRLLTQKSTWRTGEGSRFSGRCIVQPSKVFEVGFHHISKQNEEYFTPVAVGVDSAVVYRFNRCLQWDTLDILCAAVVADPTLHKYGEELKVNYDDMVFEINKRRLIG